MTEQPQKKSKIEKLELNKETVTDLTQEEAEGAQGGMRAVCADTGDDCSGTMRCSNYCKTVGCCTIG